MEEIYKLALTNNPVDLVVDKNLKVSSSINTALPEEETFLFKGDSQNLSITIPSGVNIIKIHVSSDVYTQTHYVKVSQNTEYNIIDASPDDRNHLIKSSTGITYIDFYARGFGRYLTISYSASINKETNIYNSDYINDDNYIYYYVSTRATSSSDVTTKHQVTKNTTWQQAIDSGQNYAGITFNEKGIACCREGSTLMGAIYVNDIIESDAKYGFYEVRLDV